MDEAMEKAVRVIRGEHRSLGAVLHAMRAVIEEAVAGQLEVNFALLWRMLYYIEAYPDKLHHPKEDHEFFPRLRARSADAATLIEELERQHHESQARLNEVRIALAHHEAGVAGALDALAAAVDRYADFYWRHMTMEEQQLLPLAQRELTGSDWVAIAEAFESNEDPLLAGVSTAFWERLREIVRMTPAPVGLGDVMGNT